MLLDFLTVFFIVAGCALLWLNLRGRRSRIVLTKTDDAHQSAPAWHNPDDTEIRALLAALKPPSIRGPGQPGSRRRQRTSTSAGAELRDRGSSLWPFQRKEKRRSKNASAISMSVRLC